MKKTNSVKQADYITIAAIPLIPLTIPFIIIILFIIFSFNIYAKNTNEDKELLISNNVQSTNDNVSSSILEKSEIISTNNNTENEENTIFDNTSQKDTNYQTYTMSSGKSYNVIATLNIPSLDIKYPILSSTSNSLLKIALNKYWGANPNEVGNMVIVGHNYKNTKFFSKLPNIQKNAIVKITDLKGVTLDYKVYDTKIINPYDNSCTSQLTNGKTEITLITCCDNGKNRFVVKAKAN